MTLDKNAGLSYNLGQYEKDCDGKKTPKLLFREPAESLCISMVQAGVRCGVNTDPRVSWPKGAPRAQ